MNDSIDSFWVSTDDATIAQVAIQEGAQVIHRPNHLASDTSTTAAVVKHALDFLPDDLDGVVLLQPTNPLRPDGLLPSAIELFGTRKYDSVYSVSPLHRKVGFIQNDQLQPLNYGFGERSQDMRQLHFENGLIYISSIDTILQDKIIGDSHGILVVDHVFGEVDIDTKDDLDFAAYLMNKFLNS